MKRLWAPWRLEYIKGEKDAECFLCRGIAREQDREDLIVRRGRLCGVIMNRYPYNNGHLMVFPYRHVHDMCETTPEEQAEMMTLMNACIAVLRRLLNPEGINVGINLGKAAGAGLEEHVHMHIVPRWVGDTNFMAVMDDTKVIPQALDELWMALREAMDAL